MALRVTEAFKGDFQPDDVVPVVVGLSEEGNVEEEFAGLVGDEGVFFIAPSGAPRPEFGVPGLPPGERSGNWLPVTSQGVAINDQGTAVFAMNKVEHGFPATLNRIPFAELERRIREIAGE